MHDLISKTDAAALSKGRFNVAIQLMLQTRVSYSVFVARQRYQREILRWSCNEIDITFGWDTANRCVRNSCEKRYSLFCFRLVIASA